MDPLSFDLEAPDQPGCGFSRHQLRCFHVGELPAETRQSIEQHAEACLDCQAILEEFKSDDAAFRTHIPFVRFQADHVRKVEGTAPGSPAVRRMWRWLTGGGVALAAALATVVLLMPRGPTDPQQQVGQRLKGRVPGLGFIYRTTVGVRAGRDGQRLAKGDQIHFMVRTADPKDALVVLGIDGRGSVTVYHAGTAPDGAWEAASPLPDSVVLDDAVGTERFFAVTSSAQAPQTLQHAAEAAARQLVERGVDLKAVQALPLDVEARQDSVLIEKVTR